MLHSYKFAKLKFLVQSNPSQVLKVNKDEPR